VIAHLTEVKGIGTWTAQMFLIFSLRRPDVLPTGDFGIQTAIRKHYRKRRCRSLPNGEDRQAVDTLPFVACWYLWKSLDTKTSVEHHVVIQNRGLCLRGGGNYDLSRNSSRQLSGWEYGWICG